MNYKKCAELINQIAKRIHPPIPIQELKNHPFKIIKEGILILEEENVTYYYNAIEFLYESDKSIQSTLSLDYLETNILSAVKEIVRTNIPCSIDTVKELYGRLLKMPITETEVIYVLRGIKTQEVIMRLGEFTIYKYPECIPYLTEKYSSFSNHDIFINNTTPEILLGIKVKTREHKKTIDIADNLIQSFENVMNYRIGDLQHTRSIGVFTYRPWSSISRITCNIDMGLGFSGSNRPSLPIILNYPKSTNENNEYSKVDTTLFELITKENKTEIEKRILNAVEWAGKACVDLDYSKALVQFVFAIEAMLQYNDGGFITQSIASQISDWLAFIIQDEQVERKKIAKYFKNIYKKRSSVAHGGSTQIEFDDLHIALQLVKLMIRTFLVTKPYCNMKTMDELSNYMIDMKFK